MSILSDLDPAKVEAALSIIDAAETGDPVLLADVVVALVIANNPAYAALAPVAKRLMIRALSVLLSDDEGKPGLFRRLFSWILPG